MRKYEVNANLYKYYDKKQQKKKRTNVERKIGFGKFSRSKIRIS